MSVSASSWSIRYATNEIPWDLGQPHAELTARLLADPRLGSETVGSVLVPGCGAGHDAAALANHGWDVTALDFAGSARALVEAKLRGRGRFIQADLFAYEPESKFDLVFDHTCFCAVLPEQRPAFGEAIDRFLKPTGRFISLVFPVGKPMEHGGPPHGMTVDDLSTAMGDRFALEEDHEADCNGRRWENRWAVYKRT